MSGSSETTLTIDQFLPLSIMMTAEGFPYLKGDREMNIEYRHGHYVVLDDNGDVYCSCDTHKEAADEIVEMEGAK